MAEATHVAARVALKRFMEWGSEELWCAGWMQDLEREMACNAVREDRVPFVWLIEQAGGWWTSDGDAGGPEFRHAAFGDLRAEAGTL